MASTQPKPSFLTALPAEIRQEIYIIYTLNFLKEAGLSYEAFEGPEFDDELDFMAHYSFPIYEIFLLTPPLMLTCKAIAAEYTPAAKKHAVVVYEMTAKYGRCSLTATSTFTIGRVRAANLRQVRVIWRIAFEHFEEVPCPLAEIGCTLNAALPYRASNITTIQAELYDNKRKKTCDNRAVQKAMEDTLDDFVKCAICDNGLNRLELVGCFRECWIDDLEKRHKKEIQILRGRPLSPKFRNKHYNLEMCGGNH